MNYFGGGMSSGTTLDNQKDFKASSADILFDGSKISILSRISRAGRGMLKAIDFSVGQLFLIVISNLVISTKKCM